MAFSPIDIVFYAGLGLVAGVLGGLLGIGGSVILIPGMAVFLHDANPESQHLYQATAMMVNIAVSVPAALRHRRSGTIRADLFRILLPAAAVAIVAGVLLSNLIPGLWLRRVFAAFLLYAAVSDIWNFVRQRPDFPPEGAVVTVPRGVSVGGVMGAAAGLLGIGGGVIGIPLAQRLCRLPLKQCIGVSSAVMCLTAIAGAGVKTATLGEHGYSPGSAVIMAAAMAPTAVLGGRIGAGLTQRLPTTAVRVAMVLLLLLSAWQMSGL